MRMIDADELYRGKFHGVAEIIPPDERHVESYKRGWNDALDAAADKSCTPTIEPERKTGKWLTEYLDGIPGRRAEIKYCSECCQVSPCRYNYCPNCGADMRGEGHETN